MNCELCNSVGWIDTFNTEDRLQEIQKCDDCNIFKTDKEAQEEVQQ
jgi:ribosome-binding protein aMBF1 (putative translation factor)